MATADDFRRWFAYERDSHAKALDSLARVPAELKTKPAFQHAIDLVAHITAARRLWLFRLGAIAEPVTDIFPQGWDLDQAARRLEETEALWEKYLAPLDDERMAQRFEYQSLDGPGFRNTIADILTQLFGHSLYHRGQIALLVRSLGCEPAVTDFVFWTREPV